jgi:hypothetical protein
LAVAVTLAWPLVPVLTLLAERVAVGPLEGAAKLTVTPETGSPLLSSTVTVSDVLKAAPIAALCVVPAEAVSVVGVSVVVGLVGVLGEELLATFPPHPHSTAAVITVINSQGNRVLSFKQASESPNSPGHCLGEELTTA